MSALLASLAKPLQLRSREGHEPGRKVTWLELFFDLVFVAAVSQVATPLGHDYSFAAFGRLVLLFVLIWWAWHGHTTYATRFDSDDVVQRVLTLLQMFAAIVMANLVRQVGRKAAFELVALGEPVDAQQALQLGMVNRVVAPESLLPEVLLLADKLCAVARPAMAETKRLFHEVADLSLADALEKGRDTNRRMRGFSKK